MAALGIIDVFDEARQRGGEAWAAWRSAPLVDGGLVVKKSFGLMQGLAEFCPLLAPPVFQWWT
jgi:hypothetical protein